MKCENCGNEHDGSYGSGRFCSEHCRRVYIGKKSIATRILNGTFSSPFLNEANRPKHSPYGTWKCCYCGLVFDTRKLLAEHKHNEHPHPKCQAWNKGLTKETSDAMRRRSETIAKRMASGEIKPSRLGKHWYEEDKKRISEQRKQYLKLHPDKVPYVLNHSSKKSFHDLSVIGQVGITVKNQKGKCERKIASSCEENEMALLVKFGYIMSFFT